MSLLPAMSSTGIGSGLDVTSIVNGLMTIEKQPLDKLQSQATSFQTKLSAFGTLQSQLANLRDVADRLTGADAWRPVQATLGDPAVATATATATAAAGTHTLQVDRLARPQILASGRYAASTTAVGTGTLTLTLGTTAADGSFTARAGATPVTVTITPANNTLAGVRDAINAAKAGVTASIVNDAQGSRLVLRGADGADSSVRIEAADDDGNATDTAGLSALAWNPAAPVAGAMAQTQSAQDARFFLDGVELSSATNAPKDVLDGVTLTLKQTTAGPVQLTVAVQDSAIRKNVTDFIAAYNTLNGALRVQTQADPGGKTRGPLQADSTAMSLLNGLRAVLRGGVTGLGAPNSLAAAGIALQQDGSLKIDEARFAKALEAPGQLAGLFTRAQDGADPNTRGFALRLRDFAKALAADDGTLGSRMSGIKRSVEANKKQQDALEARLERTEVRLRAQYQALDTQMSSLNAQMAKMKSALGLG